MDRGELEEIVQCGTSAAHGLAGPSAYNSTFHRSVSRGDLDVMDRFVVDNDCDGIDTNDSNVIVVNNCDGVVANDFRWHCRK